MRIISRNSCKITRIYLSHRFSSLKNSSLQWTTTARKDSLEDMKYWFLKKLRRLKQLCFIQLLTEKTNKNTQIFIQILLYIRHYGGLMYWTGEIRPACMYAKLLSSCLTLCDPMDCNPSGSSVHGILQARIPEWVATPSSRGSSQPRDRTHVSCISCIGRWILYH